MKALIKIPLPYLITEGIVVVISILLAFSIDAWWDEKNDFEEVKSSLQLVLEDLRASSVLVNRNLSATETRHNSIVALLKASIRDDYELKGYQIDTHLSNLLWYQAEPLIRPAGINSLIYSGMFGQITNSELRRDLAHWPSRSNYLENQFVQHQQFLNDVLWPYLRQHASSPQILRRIMFATGQPGDERGTLPVAPINVVDQSELLKSQEFANVLAQYWSLHNDLRIAYESADTWLDRSIEILESDLGEQHSPVVANMFELRERNSSLTNEGNADDTILPSVAEKREAKGVHIKVTGGLIETNPSGNGGFRPKWTLEGEGGKPVPDGLSVELIETRTIKYESGDHVQVSVRLVSTRDGFIGYNGYWKGTVDTRATTFRWRLREPTDKAYKISGSPIELVFSSESNE